jgi:XapX domain-containing protein
MVDWTLTLLATCTGLVTGALFRFLEIPIPAPPELPGLMGIVGIYAGFKIVEYLGVSVGALESLGA